MNYFYKIKLG